MNEILDAIRKRTDLPGTFKQLDALIPGTSSEDLRPVIAASIELAQTLDLKADDDAIKAMNRVWTQSCNKSTEDGAFLYDRILTTLETTDWSDAAAGERAYKLVVVFKDRPLDLLGYNTNLRLALRANLARLTALIERLVTLEDRQLFTIERSIYTGRFGELIEGLLDVFSQHSNWTGDDDLRAAGSALVQVVDRRFPYVGNVLTVGLLETNPHCDRLLAEIIDAHIIANQPDGLLREIGNQLMSSFHERFNKRAAAVLVHLAPLAAKWTAANADLFVERFFARPLRDAKERKTELAKSKGKRGLAEMVLGLGHQTPKLTELAQWLEEASALKSGKAKKGAARPAKAGAVFKDLNFKLLVIEALMYRKAILKPRFDVHEYAKNHVDREISIEAEGHEVIPEAKQYFENLAITKTQLAKVTHLAIDGGAEVYLQIIPFWDGEANAFDIKSVEDAALLPNLKEFDFGDPTEQRKQLGPALQARGVKVLPE